MIGSDPINSYTIFDMDCLTTESDYGILQKIEKIAKDLEKKLYAKKEINSGGEKYSSVSIMKLLISIEADDDAIKTLYDQLKTSRPFVKDYFKNFPYLLDLIKDTESEFFNDTDKVRTMVKLNGFLIDWEHIIPKQYMGPQDIIHSCDTTITYMEKLKTMAQHVENLPGELPDDWADY